MEHFYFLAMSTLHATLLEQTSILEQACIDSPRLSAEVLLAHALSIDRNELLKKFILTPCLPLDTPSLQKFYSLIQERKEGKPVAYLTGKKEFWGKEFFVTKDTLIPRPETELLVEIALKLIDEMSSKQPTENFTFADLGTGTGCIGLSIAMERPFWKGYALDISQQALQVAKKNCEQFAVSSLHLVRGDFTHLPFAPNSLQIIVSNPPYVTLAEYQTISHEVKNYEPFQALVPANDTSEHGLSSLIAVIKSAHKALTSEGWLLLESGYLQPNHLLNELCSPHWSHAKIIKDLAGLDRVTIAQKQ